MSQSNLAEIPRKRALAYIRISSQRQINGESSETQKEFIERYAEANNIEIVDTFYDEAKSGKNTDREELQNMLAYAAKHKGEIDYVIVYKMNRASRDIDTYVMGFRVKLKLLGVSIRSATEPIDDTPLGQFMELFSVLVGQMDNETKRGFTVDNMKALAYQGYWQHPPVLGYDTHKISNDVGKLRPTLKPNSSSKLVKEVLERFSGGDITKAELTRYASSIGLRSRYSKRLSEDTINRMLRNPVYAGCVKDSFTENQVVDGKHEPLIDKETYELNQALLEGSSNKRIGEVHEKANPDYPLRGTVLCQNCRKPMYASAPRTGSGGRSPRYHCSRVECRGKSSSVKADTMHEDFLELLRRMVPSEAVLGLYKDVLLSEAGAQLKSINARIAKARTRLNTIADTRLSTIRKFSADQITEQDKDDVIRQLDEEKLVHLEEVHLLERQQAISEADIELALGIMRDIAKQWEVASVEAGKRFQNVIFPRGVVYDQATRRFGTTHISTLYAVAGIEKTSEEVLKSNLVAEAGLEPATSWL